MKAGLLSFSIRWDFLSVLLVSLFLVCPARAGTPERKPAEVEVIRNIAYYEGLGADPVRHRLDIYLPKGKKGFPVLFFIHGGAWMHGNKNHFGIYAALGRCLARHGIALVSPNYRLSPGVKHPEHIKDVARAFAWTHKNIAKYGGRPDEVFVGGHSAGGHLAALLGTDERYLKAHGLTLAAIRGVIPISGVYTVPDTPILRPVFGKDRAVFRDASPINHCSAASPPFLILYSDHELPGCEGKQAEAFAKALRAQSCQAEGVLVARRNHVTILIDALHDSDPAMRHLLSFIGARVALHRLTTEGPRGVDYLAELLAR
jgi:acetyl esterase/lipase